jgi:hypothetical protein
LLAGRRGRVTNSPPQLGQVLASLVVAQFTQKVHSNVQMRASCDSLGKSQLQHSQLGRIASICSFLLLSFNQNDDGRVVQAHHHRRHPRHRARSRSVCRLPHRDYPSRPCVARGLRYPHRCRD